MYHGDMGLVVAQHLGKLVLRVLLVGRKGRISGYVCMHLSCASNLHTL